MSDRTLVEKVRVTDVLKAQAQAFRLDTGHGTQIGPGITRDGNVVRLLVCYDEQPDEFESSKVLLLPLQGKEVDPCF